MKTKVVPAVCSVEGCDRKHYARGFCNVHYQAFWKSKDYVPLRDLRPKVCTVDGCSEPVKSRGWCERHYKCWRAHGDPEWLPPTDEERFWAKVDKNGPIPRGSPHLGRCWFWTAYRNPLGYGLAHFGGRNQMAHRVAYELLVGPIPEWCTDCDHLCRNPSWVNPSHIKPGTHRDNMLISRSPTALAARTMYCPRGHEYTPENTYVDRKGRRYCRECARITRADRLRRALPCRIEGCSKPAVTRELCDGHYTRFRRTGDPEGRLTSRKGVSTA